MNITVFGSRRNLRGEIAPAPKNKFLLMKLSPENYFSFLVILTGYLQFLRNKTERDVGRLWRLTGTVIGRGERKIGFEGIGAKDDR